MEDVTGAFAPSPPKRRRRVAGGGRTAGAVRHREYPGRAQEDAT